MIPQKTTAAALRTAALAAASLLTAAALTAAALGLYYLFIAGVAAVYNGQVNNSAFLDAVTPFAYIIAGSAAPLILLFLMAHWRHWITGAPAPQPPPPRVRPEAPKTPAAPPPALQVGTRRIAYPLWGPKKTALQLAAAAAALAMFAVLRHDLFTGQFFLDQAEASTLPWIIATYEWIASWWSPPAAWIFLSLTAVNLAKGTADTLIRRTRQKPAPEENPA